MRRRPAGKIRLENRGAKTKLAFLPGIVTSPRLAGQTGRELFSPGPQWPAWRKRCGQILLFTQFLRKPLITRWTSEEIAKVKSMNNGVVVRARLMIGRLCCWRTRSVRSQRKARRVCGGLSLRNTLAGA